MTEIISGDLLTCDAEIIVQQCNCVTIKTHGLSGSIAAKFSYGNVYARRARKSANTATDNDRDTPGSIVLCEPDSNKKGPIIACLMAQIAPGKPGIWARQYSVNAETDSAGKRLMYFKQCLKLLRAEVVKRKVKTVAFPYQIGCGVAGGDWTLYRTALDEFSESMLGVRVVIYKLQQTQ